VQVSLRYFLKRLEESAIDENLTRQIQENRTLRAEVERVSRQWYKAHTRCGMLESAVGLLQAELKRIQKVASGGAGGYPSSNGSGFSNAISISNQTARSLLQLGGEYKELGGDPDRLLGYGSMDSSNVFGSELPTHSISDAMWASENSRASRRRSGNSEVGTGKRNRSASSSIEARNLSRLARKCEIAQDFEESTSPCNEKKALSSKENLQALIRKLEDHVGGQSDKNSSGHNQSMSNSDHRPRIETSRAYRQPPQHTLMRQCADSDSNLIDASITQAAEHKDKEYATMPSSTKYLCDPQSSPSLQPCKRNNKNSFETEVEMKSLETSGVQSFAQSKSIEKVHALEPPVEGGECLEGTSCPTCGMQFDLKSDLILHLRSNLQCYFQAFRSEAKQ